MVEQRRSILVTGAASGIGAAVCRVMAGPWTAILLHTRRNRDGAEAVAHQVRDAGGMAEVVLGDLADPDIAAAVVAATMRRYGRLDVLISNAGFADRTPFAELTNQALAASTEAIQGAFFRLCHAALPHLKAAAASQSLDPPVSATATGRVIAVSSFVAHAFRTDLPAFPASAAAKAGLEALVRSLAMELGPAGVTVNAVVPGFIRKDAGAHRAIDPAALAAQTARIPLRRIGTPEDVAAVIAFLASAAAGYVTGQTIHVDGGLVM
jgi:3-oxoacyl-[acyl-carrier protein] reductase